MDTRNTEFPQFTNIANPTMGAMIEALRNQEIVMIGDRSHITVLVIPIE